MKRFLLGLSVLVLACGSSSGSRVKTPDELVEEQERLAEEQERQSREGGGSHVEAEETDLEKGKKFDKRQADLELKRATRSAETCAGVVSEEGPSGQATVTLVFGNDGHVKEASISAPFSDTALGNCALRAMKAVIVPSFVGDRETVEWELDLTVKEAPKPAPKKR
jgi:hypothetical protein